MYGKVFDSMYEGTLYGHWQSIVTLQQMLVLCNSEGVVDMTPQAIRPHVNPARHHHQGHRGTVATGPVQPDSRRGGAPDRTP